MNTDLDRLSTLKIPAGERNVLLEFILLYYRLHLPGMKEIQSHKILHEVLAS